MKQNYFTHNGIKYYSGTTVIIRRRNTATGVYCDDIVTFISMDYKINRIIIKMDDYMYNYPYKEFTQMVVGIQKAAEHIPDDIISEKQEYTFFDELNIDGLFLAWMWYIFIMAIATIFYARIGIWLFASVIFFSYRNNKLKEEGYK